MDSVALVWRVLEEEVVGSRVCLRVCRFALSAAGLAMQVLVSWTVTIDLVRMYEVPRGSCTPTSRTAVLGAVTVSGACLLARRDTAYLRVRRPLPVSLQPRNLLDLTGQIVSSPALARILVVPCAPDAARPSLLLLLFRHSSLTHASALRVAPAHFSLCKPRGQRVVV